MLILLLSIYSCYCIDTNCQDLYVQLLNVVPPLPLKTFSCYMLSDGCVQVFGIKMVIFFSTHFGKIPTCFVKGFSNFDNLPHLKCSLQWYPILSRRLCHIFSGTSFD